MIKVTGKGNTSATIIAHSESAVDGKEIITYELEYHRYIHAESKTHRRVSMGDEEIILQENVAVMDDEMLSRNAASSRAIPVSKMIDLVRTSPAVPIHWGKNQAGMQANEECNNKVFTPLWRDVFGRMEDGKIKSDWEEAIGKTREQSWQEAATASAYHAQNMLEAGYHKQITNRLLEPFQMIKVVVTATEWDNFFWLRFHKAAQPEIQELARCMLVAKKHSVAEVLNVGEWHTPYVAHHRFEDNVLVYVNEKTQSGRLMTILPYSLEEALKISASCCAQVSYRKTDDSLEKADKVWQMLTTDERIHSSPTEHQATPMSMNFFCFDCQKDGEECWEHGVTHLDKQGKFWSNNFCGWIQHRALIANNNCTSFDYDQEIDETGLVITDNKEM